MSHSRSLSPYQKRRPALAVGASGLLIAGCLALVAPRSFGSQLLAASPCDDAIHHQFDFWLGEWLVFDATTSKLTAIDRIAKELNGCAVIQHMTWVTDQFRGQDLGYRLTGMSVSVVDDGHWLMVWVDNTYGTGLVVEGGLDERGSMVLTTPLPRGNTYTRGVWTVNTDGTVRNVGYQSRDGKTGWKQYFDFIYKPNR